jgi:hypothetical protein
LVTCFSYPPPRWVFFENIFGPRRRYDIFVPQKSWDQLKFQGKHGHTQQGWAWLFFQLPIWSLRFKIEISESSRGFTG